MLLHFFFLPAADGDGNVTFEEEAVFFHGFDVVHIEEKAVVAFEEAAVFQEDGGQFLVGVGGGNFLVLHMDDGIASFAAVHVDDTAEGDAEGFAAWDADFQDGRLQSPFGQCMVQGLEEFFLWEERGLQNIAGSEDGIAV